MAIFQLHGLYAASSVQCTTRITSLLRSFQHCSESSHSSVFWVLRLFSWK